MALEKKRKLSFAYYFVPPTIFKATLYESNTVYSSRLAISEGDRQLVKNEKNDNGSIQFQRLTKKPSIYDCKYNNSIIFVKKPIDNLNLQVYIPIKDQKI